MSETAILPRVFISCVSEEFRTIRRTVEATVRHLGYEPVTMDNWSTGDGELLDWHRRQIGSCVGLIQITGIAYGAEPPFPQPAADGFPPRYSYTQWEFHYARATGKKTWIIQPGPACTRDTPVELLDLLKDPATGKGDPLIPGALERQRERRQLQAGYVQLLKDGNHLRHAPADDKDLQILILKLRDIPAGVRADFARWHDHIDRKTGQLLRYSLVTLGLLLLICLGGWAGWSHLSRGNQTAIRGIAGIKEGQTLDTGRVRAHLITASEDALKKDLAEADAVQGDFQKRETLRQAAKAAHKQRLSRVEELVTAFAELAAATGNSPVLVELLRVLDEQGIDQALAYLDTRRPEILQKVSNKQEESRTQLQPLLTAAQAALTAGKNDEAESLFRDLLHPDHPRWPDARHEFWVFLVGTKGPRAESHATKSEARAIYGESERHARRLTEDEPDNTEWQRDLSISHKLLGDVARAQGNLDDATRRYAESLAVAEKLAAADPANTEWQRDLGVSHDRLGDVAVAKGNLGEAARRYSTAHVLHERLASADPSDSLWQSDLSISHDLLGNVARAQGNLDEAARRYSTALAVREKLAAADPANTDWQRDLSISHDYLGEVAHAQGNLDDAARHYAESLAVREKLAAADPANTEWQRNLSVSSNLLGDVAVAQGNLDEAARRYADSLAVAAKLAAADPGNTLLQGDLSISHDRLGDVARARGSLDDAARRYAESLAIREKLAAADPANTEWQRNLSISQLKLGNVAVDQDKLDEAARRYADSLAVAEKLAAADPANTEWQRGLSLTHEKLGDLASSRGRLDEAERHYIWSFAIAEKLTGSDGQNTRWQSDLSRNLSNFGDVASDRGRLDDAARHYADGLAIIEKLADTDSSNTNWQIAISDLHFRLGRVALGLGDLGETTRRISESIAITRKLADTDPTNMIWQRDLFACYLTAAEVAEARDDAAAAMAHCLTAHDILFRIERQGLHVSEADRRKLQRIRENFGLERGQ